MFEQIHLSQLDFCSLLILYVGPVKPLPSILGGGRGEFPPHPPPTFSLSSIEEEQWHSLPDSSSFLHSCSDSSKPLFFLTPKKGGGRRTCQRSLQSQFPPQIGIGGGKGKDYLFENLFLVGNKTFFGGVKRQCMGMLLNIHAQ